MKKVLLTLAIAAPVLVFSQWKMTSLGNSAVKEGKQNIEVAQLYSLDKDALQQQVKNAPERFSNQPGKMISFPNVEGKLEKYEVWEASNFAPELQAKYPEIRSYVGVGIDDPTAYLRFSVSPAGVQTMTLRAGNSEFIEPYTEDHSKYIVFNSKAHRNKGEVPFECSTPHTNALLNDSQEVIETHKSSAGVFKTYRLAQSVTGEYSQYFGGTMVGALGGINATLTRMNGIFEKDFALQLVLIPNNDEVIYLDPSTDPYTSPMNIANTQTQLHNTLSSVFGYNNFDIGHIFHRTGNGGNAGCIGCICDGPAGQSKGKATGYTSSGNGIPEGDLFDVDFVTHEFGHQLGANHTLSSHWEGTGVQVEPGSGSTIMGYAGTVIGLNVQSSSDDYFTFRSIDQVQTNLQNKPCGTTITLSHQTPVVNAGLDYEIPNGTAFKLTGTGTDDDALVFNWEQNDTGIITTVDNNSRVSFTKTIGPNFRSHPYTTEPVRYLPKFEYVLETEVSETAGYWRNKWESVTTVGRTFNFTLTAKDNNEAGGQTQTDAMRVYVRSAGPFKVTSPAQNQTVDLSTNSILVEWDVAGTDASPINTANVKISLSTDNGATFTVLAESTANDGSETLEIPAGTTETENARILIEAIDNIYYAVSRPFKLSGTMGVADLNKSTLGIYPNPNNGQFFVKGGNISKGEIKTAIFDTAGKMVYNNSSNHTGGKLDQSYNVKLPTGVYVVVIETVDGKTTEKLIIK